MKHEKTSKKTVFRFSTGETIRQDKIESTRKNNSNHRVVHVSAETKQNTKNRDTWHDKPYVNCCTEPRRPISPASFVSISVTDGARNLARSCWSGKRRRRESTCCVVRMPPFHQKIRPADTVSSACPLEHSEIAATQYASSSMFRPLKSTGPLETKPHYRKRTEHRFALRYH